MLAGAAAAHEQVNQTHRPQKIRAQLDAWLAPVRRKAGTAAQKLLDRGRELTLGEAIKLGLDEQSEDAWRVGASPALTGREQEVATLVARGLSNRAIAGRLFLSVRTVEVHVDRILTKLGFANRTQLAAWAHDEGLLPRDT
jgi:non-specific serine/threonine protein kinase